MAKIPGLTIRDGVYYYRVRVPLDLVSIFGKKEIKESLKTKEYAEVKKRYNLKAIHWDAQGYEWQVRTDGPIVRTI